VASPYTPFFRFFLPVQAWVPGLIVFWAAQAAEWVSRRRRPVALAITALLVVLVARDEIAAAAGYRARLAEPFERAMEFVSGTTDVLRAERRDAETIEAPLAFLPYLMLELDVRR